MSRRFVSNPTVTGNAAANLELVPKQQLDSAISGLSATYQPLDNDLTTIAGLTATTDSFLQAKSSAWASRTIAQVRADISYLLGPIVAKTANYTATDADEVITVDCSGGDRTITLPAASGRAGKVYTIKKIAGVANYVIIDGNASETIDGSLTETIYIPGDMRTIICDGSNWFIINDKNTPIIASPSSPSNGGTLTVDASTATVFRVSTGVAGFTLAVPTKPTDGQQLNFEISPSVTHSLTLNASILLTSGITSPIAVPSGKKLFLGLRYVSTAWFAIAQAIQS
jgi:hypothetical protein